MSDRTQSTSLGQNLLSIAITVVFLVMSSTYVLQQNTLRNVLAPSSNFLLAGLHDKDGAARQAQSVPSPEAMSVALKAQPLNPAIVNAALFAEAAYKPNQKISPGKMVLLGRLGWRSTVALQNRIFYAVERKDLDQIVAITDAMLRREELMDQGFALMNLLELAPSTRNQLADTLAQNPTWRLGYFQTAAQPKGTQAIAARSALVKALSDRDAPMNRTELHATALLLVKNGFAQDAYKYWLEYRNTRPALVNDPRFRWAYDMRNESIIGMPFEWELLAGVGFWTELTKTENKIAVNINWSRKGVPVLLAQQLYLGSQRDRLVLDVAGVDLPVSMLDDISFTLVCPQSQVIFDQIVRRDASRYVLRSADALTCSDPQLRVSGRPARIRKNAGSTGGIDQFQDISLMLTEISLKRIREQK